MKNSLKNFQADYFKQSMRHQFGLFWLSNIGSNLHSTVQPSPAAGIWFCVCVTYWHIGIRVKVQVHGVNIRLHSETENHLNYSSWPFSSWEGTEMWKNPWKHAFLNIVFMNKNVLAKCTKTNDAMFLYLNLKIILISGSKSKQSDIRVNLN